MLTSTGTMLCPTPQQAGFKPTSYCEESGIKKQTWTTYKTLNKKECTTEVFFCDLFSSLIIFIINIYKKPHR